MAGLRQLTERERAIVGEHAARHGQVRGLEAPIADDDGNISMPLVRVSVLERLHRRGTISAGEAAAGELFAKLFRIASLDPLKAADMERVPAGRGGDLPPSAERCRRRVADAMIALGGAGSPAASAIWHICGLEWSVSRWAATARRSQEQCCGILIGALAALAAHFAGRRRPSSAA